MSPLAFDEARRRLMSDVRRVSRDRVSVRHAAGRVLAEDLVAAFPLPAFDHSAMDGYAVSTADLLAAGPFRLVVAGESRAGAEAPPLAPDTACRIFTGAPIPPRADAVVMQEHVTREGDAVRFEERPAPGQHVRRAGEDLPRGATALARGARLTPGALALAAMLDRSEILVARRPARVTILCTGDELRAPGASAGESAGVGGGAGAGVAPEGSGPAPGPRRKGRALIPESNSAPLAALAAQGGADVRVAPIAADDPGTMPEAIERALDGTDLLLTVGGVSVGDHDVVRPALARAGVEIEFWRVAIKPGKPLAVGKSPAARVLGLPGNPASAIVTFVLFGMPLLRAMQGDSRPVPLHVRARLASPRKRTPDRLEFARGLLELDSDTLTARLHENQASGSATSLAASDGLALIPPGTGPLAAGALVDFVRWVDA